MKCLKNIIMLIVFLIFISGDGLSRAETVHGNSVTVYYFHRTLRCPSCLLLEELTREAVLSGFETELKDGKLYFIAVNLDEADHEHFVKDYSLSFQSVVISKKKKGKEKEWKRLDQVWELLHEESKLIEYIQKEIHFFI